MAGSTSDDIMRSMALEKQREREAAAHSRRQQAEHQRQKEALLKDSQRDRSTARFVNVNESLDDQLKKSTIGLVTLEDFQKTKEDLEEEQRRLAAKTAAEKVAAAKKARKEKKRERAKLSFADEEEDPQVGEKRAREEAEAVAQKKKKLTKNPAVDTTFLPDREREAKEREEREELRKTWLAQQEKIKSEGIEITYSYWDGSGHRKVVECKKGDSIATFLGNCRAQVPELKGTSIDNLMYIKEDLIIPHHYTFYDFIINKARGKSGPLFNFDVHDDVRMISDASKEKDESHAGKVVERTWYNRFKHIFPASRWEVYDPDKDYGSYKIA